MIEQKVVTNSLEPGPLLWQAIKAAFLLKGTTVNGWSKDNDVCSSHVRAAVIGVWNGPKGIALRNRVIQEAGLLKMEKVA